MNEKSEQRGIKYRYAVPGFYRFCIGPIRITCIDGARHRVSYSARTNAFRIFGWHLKIVNLMWVHSVRIVFDDKHPSDFDKIKSMAWAERILELRISAKPAVINF